MRRRARRKARREKSASGESGAGEGLAAERVGAGADGLAGLGDRSSKIREKIGIVGTSGAQFTAKARGSKDDGQKDRW